jgi:Ca-activated chloride channel family protein
MLPLCSNAQYYLRGEVKDNKNKPLPYAKIFLHSLRMNYYAGAGSATFGLNSKFLYDSLTISLEGYETRTIRVKTDQWQTIQLKPTIDAVSKSKTKLISYTKDHSHMVFKNWYAGDETYFQLVENDVVDASVSSNTGYSLNVNKAAYSNVRRFINMGSEAPTDAVRTEELINYFNLDYQSPKGDSIFKVNTKLTSCPWNKKNDLLFINVSAKQLEFKDVPPGNFVFLIDVSGSMDMPNRLPLIKAAFQLFVKNLRSIDTVSIVTYGGFIQIWLDPTSGAEKEKILRSIESLEAAGDTPGASAIKIAYQVARKKFIKGGNNRVILATDGDFNVGETSEKALDELITKQSQSGVYLTCLGVGMGNLKDSKLQTLAKNGNGNYAYLDEIQEAERVLVKELSQTFYTVADDAFMSVHMDPAMVSRYRLIGFDNKKEALSDSSHLLEGGEIGSGASVMAIFEITPTEKMQLKKKGSQNIHLANLELKYTQYQDSISNVIRHNVQMPFQPFDSIGSPYKLATAVSMYGQKIRNSKYAPDVSWSDIKRLAKSSVDPSVYIQKEFLTLIEKSAKIYGRRKKTVEQ